MSNKNLILLSIITILWTIGSWIAVLYIDRSCEFVRIIGRAHQEQVTIDELYYHDSIEASMINNVFGSNNTDSEEESASSSLFNDFDKKKQDGQIVSILHRGIHRGHLSPLDNTAHDDVCTAWSYYKNDDNDHLMILDTEMVVTRTSSIISVVLGLVVLISLVMNFVAALCRDDDSNYSSGRTCFNVTFQVLLILCSICVAICQLLTHQMSKSELCEGTNIVTSKLDNHDGNDFVNLIVWEECDTNTTSYKLTYVTTICWFIIAILAYFATRTSSSTAAAAKQQDGATMSNEKTSTKKKKQQEAEDTTTSSHDHIHGSNSKLHGSHSSNSEDVDNFFGVGKV